MKSVMLKESSFDYEKLLPTFIFGYVAQYDIENSGYRTYEIDTPDEWHYMSHQYGGVSCSKKCFHGIDLESTEAALRLFIEINRLYLPYIDLKDIKEYKELLGKYNLTCNNVFREFNDGIFPIDYSVENLDKISKTKLSDELNELIEDNKDVDWALFILTEGSE